MQMTLVDYSRLMYRNDRTACYIIVNKWLKKNKRISRLYRPFRVCSLFKV